MGASGQSRRASARASAAGLLAEAAPSWNLQRSRVHLALHKLGAVVDPDPFCKIPCMLQGNTIC